MVNSQEQALAAYRTAVGLLYSENKYEQAGETFAKLCQVLAEKDKAPCYYHLGYASNALGDPITASDFYYSAFNTDNEVCALVLPDVAPNKSYVFSGKVKEADFPDCPLCGKKGEPYWCYPLTECFATLPAEFNPVRTWLACVDCTFLWAKSFPAFGEITDNPDDESLTPRKPNVHLQPYYDELFLSLETKYLTHIKSSSDIRFLEVGLGACEALFIAQKRGYKEFGIDVERPIINLAKSMGLNAEVRDFYKLDLSHSDGEKYDIIVMGDVIEHVPDPVSWMAKTAELLSDDGVLWISTPDFQSKFTTQKGHIDPMRRNITHFTYFSLTSLYALLRRFGLEPVIFRESQHYNGSMEVVAKKKTVN